MFGRAGQSGIANADVDLCVREVSVAFLFHWMLGDELADCFADRRPE